MTIALKQRIPTFDAQRLEAIAKVLADTDTGLTGSQIGYLLQDCDIPDVDPTNTKWKRLFNAVIAFQNDHQVGKHVIVFINRAMAPASYTERQTEFRLRQDRLNTVLAFCGLQVADNGKIRRASTATTLDEATKRASRLRAALVQRNVHQDVLAFCTKELLQENYFHAVFEAMKSITTKLRRLSGATCDGTDLVHEALGMKFGSPILAINALDTETLQGEQRGFVSLLKGLYGTIRNPLAHDPKVEWDMDEQDALDILTMISLVHRKLDKAHRFSSAS
jgi:uncharacterized protein (TIGR02391 family)